MKSYAHLEGFPELHFYCDVQEKVLTQRSTELSNCLFIHTLLLGNTGVNFFFFLMYSGWSRTIGPAASVSEMPGFLVCITMSGKQKVSTGRLCCFYQKSSLVQFSLAKFSLVLFCFLQCQGLDPGTPGHQASAICVSYIFSLLRIKSMSYYSPVTILLCRFVQEYLSTRALHRKHPL